jgi:hypothetical protein
LDGAPEGRGSAGSPDEEETGWLHEYKQESESNGIGQSTFWLSDHGRGEGERLRYGVDISRRDGRARSGHTSCVGDELHGSGSRLGVVLSMQNFECRVQNSKVRNCCVDGKLLSGDGSRLAAVLSMQNFEWRMQNGELEPVRNSWAHPGWVYGHGSRLREVVNPETNPELTTALTEPSPENRR